MTDSADDRVMTAVDPQQSIVDRSGGRCLLATASDVRIPVSCDGHRALRRFARRPHSRCQQTVKKWDRTVKNS